MILNIASASLSNGAQQPPAQISLLPLLYADDQSYGWSEGMRAVTHALLDNLTLPDGPLVEVGCGGGQMLAQLQQRYPERELIGVDMNPLALSYAYHDLAPTT